MTKVAIQVRGLSKMYDLGLVGTGSLSKDLNRFIARLSGREDPYATIAELNDRTQFSKSGTVWALKDINFDVEQGEVLGIIGKNGAGKSTLLKVLSQITAPTKGFIGINGRVASLLEVGTGMHPEMTARQNIYLNGAIMGMGRSEIRQKLDEIVEFAGIGKYVDTPIKRFSSGMQVRLGFAVAAFLEPEILIVDEVLAVGDAEFQKKAIGKMQDVSRGGGRTVLFVSHNMQSVTNLCTKALLVGQGMIQSMGDVRSIISEYFSSSSVVSNNQFIQENCERKGNGYLRFTKVNLLDLDRNELPFVQSGQDFLIELQFKTNVDDPFVALHFSINIKDQHEYSLAHMSNTISNGEELNGLKYPSTGSAICAVRNFNLQPGTYFVDIYCSSYREPLDWVENIIQIEVQPGEYYQTGLLPPHGVSLVDNSWSYIVL